MPALSHHSSARSAVTVMIGSLLAALVFATSAAAEPRVLDLVSTGPDGGNLDMGVDFADMSADGTHAFFETQESLVSADTDTGMDTYERAGGQTTLVRPALTAATAPCGRASWTRRRTGITCSSRPTSRW